MKSANPGMAASLAQGFPLTVQELRASAGAGFIVALMGTIVSIPALLRYPVAKHVRVDAAGTRKGRVQMSDGFDELPTEFLEHFESSSAAI